MVATTETPETGGPDILSGGALKAQLARANRMNRIRTFALVVPLLAFILITFIIPIIDMLWRSVDNPTLGEYMPDTLALLEQWDGKSLPSEEVFEQMVKDLAKMREERTIGQVATQLNFENAGSRSLFMKSGRRAGRIEQGPYTQALIDIDEDWGKPETWALIKRVGQPYTDAHYLRAVDLQRDADGSIVDVPEAFAIHLDVFWRTIVISVSVTLMCLLLGYPVAYLIATLPTGIGNLLLIMVLLPFWTSLLVRTTAWVVILQTEGLLNDTMVFLGIIDERIQLIYNRPGVIIAMTHILLPFMILPLYSVMKTISPVYLRAAQSLGANPVVAYWKVYVPQTLPGIGAGALLVFILAIGYYITPMLVGGPTDQMISQIIDLHTRQTLNWGLAAALGGILLAGILVLYYLFNKVIGIDNMKLG